MIGSVFASIYRNDLNRHLPTLPASLDSTAHQSAGAAFAVASRLAQVGHPALGTQVHQAASNAFIHGFHVGCFVAAGVATAGVLLAGRFLPAQPLVLAVDLELAHPIDAALAGAAAAS